MKIFQLQKKSLNSNNIFKKYSQISFNNSIKEKNLSDINLLYNQTIININYSFPYYNDLIKESLLKIQPRYLKFKIFENLSKKYKSNCQNDLSESNNFIKRKIILK